MNAIKTFALVAMQSLTIWEKLVARRI